MMKSVREKLFGPATGKYLWCLHCERTYTADNFRTEGGSGFQMCAYADCDGDAVIDAWNWSKVREEREDRYPEDPVHGVVYPLYDPV
jgi:hypothetical protein